MCILQNNGTDHCFVVADNQLANAIDTFAELTVQKGERTPMIPNQDKTEPRRSNDSIICHSELLVVHTLTIIDLQDTDKSRYLAITEFKNSFIIRPRLLS